MRVGDIGVEIYALYRERDYLGRLLDSDISGATTLEIILEAPDNVQTVHTASFLTDGTDGVLLFTTTLAADLSVVGTWKSWGHVIGPSLDRRSEEVEFQVT